MALDKDQIIKKVYDSTNQALKVLDHTPATAPQPTVNLSADQIWKRIFDSSTGKIRMVDA
jgi:hypothetical protein